jgi:predicted metal-dependent phosphoesterase TrpH
MGRVDLHLHTTHSDGQHRPSEVVRLASDAGLKLIAVTDHDTIGGLTEAAASAIDRNIAFIPGIEITTANEKEQHILGYYIDPAAEKLNEMCKWFMQMRNERIERTISFLRSSGVMITRADVEAEAPGAYLGRPHIAAAMVTAGYVRTRQEAFEKYLSTDEYRKIPRPKPSAAESIDAIRAAGGVAVLAHPGTLELSGEAMDARIEALKALGLGGIECHYGVYDRMKTDLYLDLAERHGLIATGGSDFHGAVVKPYVLIGSGKDHLLDYDDLSVAERLRTAAAAIWEDRRFMYKHT